MPALLLLSFDGCSRLGRQGAVIQHGYPERPRSESAADVYGPKAEVQLCGKLTLRMTPRHSSFSIHFENTRRRLTKSEAMTCGCPFSDGAANERKNAPSCAI